MSKYAYNNDAGGRRTSVVQTGVAFEPVGDMFNLYDYNTRSEVVDAVRYFGSNTNDTSEPVGLQDWSYSYDNIGNRTGTMSAVMVQGDSVREKQTENDLKSDADGKVYEDER